MKALVVRQFGEADSVKVEEWAVPAPGAGEVLVDVHAAGINLDRKSTRLNSSHG